MPKVVYGAMGAFFRSRSSVGAAVRVSKLKRLSVGRRFGAIASENTCRGSIRPGSNAGPIRRIIGHRAPKLKGLPRTTPRQPRVFPGLDVAKRAAGAGG